MHAKASRTRRTACDTRGGGGAKVGFDAEEMQKEGNVGMRCLGWLLGSLVALGCATSPTGRTQFLLFSERDLDRMGFEAFEAIKTDESVSRDAETNEYVRCVAEAITAVLPSGERSGWEVVVFEDEDVNAFALPGRKIGVQTGLLAVAHDQDQLASVIGHEVGHVMAQHANERMSQNFAAGTVLSGAQIALGDDSPESRALLGALGLGTQFGVLLPFSRSHESEADLIGIELMARAGFDPAAAPALWRNMARAGGSQPPEWASTHPSHGTRIADLQRAVPAAELLRQEALANGLRPDCE